MYSSQLLRHTTQYHPPQVICREDAMDRVMETPDDILQHHTKSDVMESPSSVIAEICYLRCPDARASCWGESHQVQ